MEESIAGLPIEDEEEETILLGVESSDQENFYANCFVGIFLTSSVVNFQAMRTMLENDWHPNGGVSILDLGDGRFLFRLYFEVDVDRIEKNGPGILISIYWCCIGNCKAVGKFYWVFLEYDALAIQLGYKRIMRLRGLGRTGIVRLLHALRDINLSVVFFIETKLQGFHMVVIKRKCGFQNGIDVDLDGRRGGLSMGWNNNCKVSIRSFLRRHINIMIDKDLEEKAWRCTGFYGAPEENLREVPRNLLQFLNNCPHILWLVLGNFNEIAYLSNKKEG
ncbi:hypothetical protein Golob_003948 [Gossypium lobatum]|uniref:DUF4283 domain-containing protein n=1 Tax=Gossypium lobatum TaxID=34289 RepID=A0A7J8N008_9ROSI|nr:hypothetical protein [Gossypium lobatum]